MPTSITSPDVVAAATSRLRLEDLLQVLLTELTHQNPLKPVDNKDFMGQIAQFASLESSQALNDSINQMLTLQAINQSVGLIGRTVSATTDTGTVTGRVQSLSLAGGVPRLTIDSNGTFFTGIAIGDLERVL